MISLLDAGQHGRHTVVGVTGELDASTAPTFRDALLGQLNRGADSLVVDLRGVTFIDSTGVGSLLRIHHRQSLLGGRVHIVSDQQAVLRVLEIMQLTQRLHVVTSVAEVEACCPPSVPAVVPSRGQNLPMSAFGRGGRAGS